jgi:DNA-binding CsgD family transcriptional regulator
MPLVVNSFKAKQIHMLNPTPLMPVRSRRSHPPRDIKLSHRELEILRWMSAGKSDWAIGKILQISKKTVNWHVERIKRKFAVPTRIQTVLLAERSGLLEHYPAVLASFRRQNGGRINARVLDAEFGRLIGQYTPMVSPKACAISCQPIINLKTVLRDLAT